MVLISLFICILRSTHANGTAPRAGARASARAARRRARARSTWRGARGPVSRGARARGLSSMRHTAMGRWARTTGFVARGRSIARDRRRRRAPRGYTIFKVCARPKISIAWRERRYRSARPWRARSRRPRRARRASGRWMRSLMRSVGSWTSRRCVDTRTLRENTSSRRRRRTCDYKITLQA